MHKTVALIPARAGSKGVPNKNVSLLGGQPLLAWTIAACRKAKMINRVIVSTDSQEYVDLAVKFGAEAPFLRPEEISDDRSTDYEFIVHAMNWIAVHDEEPELIVHMRPTTPFRDPAMVDKAVKAFVDSRVATALRSVHEMSESAYKTFEIAATGQLKKVGSDATALDSANNARQIFPKTYSPNGYVDVLSTSFIRQFGLIHGDHVIPFITPVVTEVDSEADFENLEFQLMRCPDIQDKLFR